MGESSAIKSSNVAKILLSHAAGFLGILVAAYGLRRVTLRPDADLQGLLQLITGLLAFVFTAIILVRFQGTQDRISLILGAGFLLSGTALTATSILFFEFLPGTPVRLQWAPAAWWFSRIVLALLFVVALLVEHFLPRSVYPRREIAGVLLTVIAFTYLITTALHRLPPEVSPHPGAFFPSPQQLLPGAIFIVALIWFRRRLSRDGPAFDSMIYAATWLNCAAQISASQSEKLLDGPFALAQGLTMMSYTVALGGALLDNARLFEQVRYLAISDPLTGLANYRRLLDVLESETQRSNRIGKPFSVLLLDLDGLKKINDTYGHLVGSRAICRLADILRVACRSIDTAARYGGDEFAVVLPESRPTAAAQVLNRICETLASDGEEPRLSVSAGIASYPQDGKTIEELLHIADRALYTMKRGERTDIVKRVGL